MITVPRLCIAALLCLCCAAAQAAPRPEQNARARPIPKEVMALEEWMSFYYQSPTPEKFVKYVRVMARRDLWRERKSGFPTLMFMSEVIRANPKRAARWCKALASLPEKQHGYLGWAFHNADVPASERCLRQTLRVPAEDLRLYKRTPRYDPAKQLPGEALGLDMLWAAFFATGDTRMIHRLIDMLGLPGDRHVLLSAAAEWSLTSNAAEHPLVLKTLKARQKDAHGKLRETLDKILAKSGR